MLRGRGLGVVRAFIWVGFGLGHAYGIGQCGTACLKIPLTGFVSRTSANGNEKSFLVEPGLTGGFGQRFRFLSFNAPNLLRIESNSSSSRSEILPSKEEIWDVICSIQQMGGKVVRTYPFAFGEGPDKHVQFFPHGSLYFNETWFKALDMALEAANYLGVRLIIPFINVIDSESWGGVTNLCQWTNVKPRQFFSHAATRKIFKDLVRFVVTRVNSITGVKYNEDPAILAWELGNEMFMPPCDDLRGPVCCAERGLVKAKCGTLDDSYPVPVKWTREMSAFIKSLDANHLVADGGFPTRQRCDKPDCPQVYDIPEIDIMGGTYYRSDSTSLLNAALDSIAGRKVFVVKEFGIAGDSDIVSVTRMINVFKRSAVQSRLVSNSTYSGNISSRTEIAGGLLWSLRGHARDGGFYFHYEQSLNNTYSASLHWPGYSDGAPSYEKEIFQMTSEVNIAIMMNSSTKMNITVPCAPNVTIVSESFFPPCMHLLGSTGAARYELWMAPADGGRSYPVFPSESWIQIYFEGVDMLQERASFLTLPSTDTVKALTPWGSEKWYACARACDNMERCSSCSTPVVVTIDPKLASWDSLSPCGIAARFVTSLRQKNFEEAVDYYTISLALPQWLWKIFWSVISVCIGGAMVTIGMIVLEQRKHIAARFQNFFSKLVRNKNEPTQNPVNFLDGPDFFAPASPSLAVIECIAVLFAILSFRCENSLESRKQVQWPLSSIVAWSSSSFPALFLMAGFNAAHALRSRQRQREEAGSSLPLLTPGGCFWRSMSQLWPSLLTSCILGFLLSSDELDGEYVLLPFGASCWYPSLRNNEINSAAWLVGALLFNSVVLLPVWDALREREADSKLQKQLLAVCWLFTLWRAIDLLGMRILLLDRIVLQLFLRAHTPAFIGGILLASLQSPTKSDESTISKLGCNSNSLAREKTLMSPQALRMALINLIIFLIPFPQAKNPNAVSWADFASAWVQSGGTLPIFALLIWSCSNNKIWKTAEKSRIFHIAIGPLLSARYTALLVQQLAWHIARWLQSLNESTPSSDQQITLMIFCGVLSFLTAVVHIMIAVPFSRFLRSFGNSSNESGSQIESNLAAWTNVEILAIYYGSVILTCTFFYVCQTHGGDWLTLVDLRRMPELSEFLQQISWALLLPAPALFQGFLGAMIFPAVLQTKVPLLAQQLSTVSRKLVEECEDLIPADFKIYFRIVTRGHNPQLVLSNCFAARKVLESSVLPPERWIIEVVTDNDIHLPCWVKELVVPAEYNPPNGCKYKARALHFALTASSAADTDWIVHLDEETKFDAETLAHIYAHCHAETCAVNSWRSPGKKWPAVGQGVIYYNQDGFQNYLTGLADTIRIADDYSKFAFQYRALQFPLIGMHGSFVVARNSLEKEFGWDWGIVGSITEDTYLAMRMASQGVKFKWVGGKMYEQSPFNCVDFAKQRARWFSGLWLCVLTPTLPLWHRVFLGIHLVSWSSCPIGILLTWANLLTVFPRSEEFIFAMSMIFAVPFWSYCLGFIFSVRPRQMKHGWIEWILLFACHIILLPLYTLLETAGVVVGLLDRSTYTKFHVVQKEGQNISANTLLTATGTATEMTAIPMLWSSEQLHSNNSCSIGGDIKQSTSCHALRTPSDSKLDQLHFCMKAPAVGNGYANVLKVQSNDLEASYSCQVENTNGNIKGSSEPAGREIDIEYWKTCLGMYPDPLDLVTDFPRKKALPTASEMSTTSIALENLDVYNLIESNEFDLGVPKATWPLCAGLATILQHYTRQHEILLGLYTPHIEKMQLLPLISRPFEHNSFHSLCSEVRDSFKGGCEHSRHLNLDEVEAATCSSCLVKVALRLRRDSNSTVKIHLTKEQNGEFPDLLFEWSTISEGTAKKHAQLACHYNCSIFLKESVDAFLEHLKTLTIASLTSVNVAVSQLPIMTDREYTMISQTFARHPSNQNNITTQYNNLAEIFQHSAAKNPDKVAVECPQSGLSLTYSILDSLSTSLAQHLRSQGRQPGSVIAIDAERCVSSIIAMISVAKVGCAYMPVDCTYPSLRIHHMLHEANVKTILCPRGKTALWTSHFTLWPELSSVTEPTVIDVPDTTDGVLQKMDVGGQTLNSHELIQSSHQQSLKAQTAAILYTSGSTGMPKGVILSNGAMIQQYISVTYATKLNQTDKVAQNTTLTFDVAGNEIWGSFLVGATVVIVDESSRLLGFESFLSQNKISVLFITPSHLGVMDPDRCGPFLRTLAVAGEAVTQSLVNRWATEKREFLNEYGPTEADVVSVHNCVFDDNPNRRAMASIGVPVVGATLRILNAQLQPTAIGVPGELCIGGDQLADGYLQQQDLTNSKFCAVCTGSGTERLYRTGDLCRWRSDGTIDYLGRIDRQVKIRGMRVEIEGIESKLCEINSVSQCCVDLKGSGENAQLVGYVVLKANELHSWSDEAASRQLAATLPTHMIPSVFIILDSMPSTSSGKIDRRRLPEPQPFQIHRLHHSADISVCENSGSRDLIMNGELNIKTFLTSQHAKGLRTLGLDSLGIVRAYHGLVANAAQAEWETRVANVIRAVCMFGVAIDHFAACDSMGPCRAVKIIALNSVTSEPANPILMRVTDIVVRSVGNYKTVAGFVMTSAYLESGMGPSALSFSKSDLVVLLVYLSMTWVFDPISNEVAKAHGLDSGNPWWLAKHRWYLVAMLYSRGAMFLLHYLRLPPAAQVVITVAVTLLSPPSMGCISAACSGSASNVVGWMDWSNAPQPFNFFFLIFFRGLEPQLETEWWTPEMQFLISRKALFVVVIYVVTFHYGRRTVEQASRLTKAVTFSLSHTTGSVLGNGWRALAFRTLLAFSCGGLFIVMACGESVGWRASEDAWIKDNGSIGGEARLTRLAPVVLASMAQIVLLGGLASAAPISMRVAGSNTLGSYVIHGYVNLFVLLYVLPSTTKWSSHLQLLVMLAIPFVTVVLIGPAFQQGVIMLLQTIVALSSWSLDRAGSSSFAFEIIRQWLRGPAQGEARGGCWAAVGGWVGRRFGVGGWSLLPSDEELAEPSSHRSSRSTLIVEMGPLLRNGRQEVASP